jgi:hypothetical protein
LSPPRDDCRVFVRLRRRVSSRTYETANLLIFQRRGDVSEIMTSAWKASGRWELDFPPPVNRTIYI